jgi:hypothetical protein
MAAEGAELTAGAGAEPDGEDWAETGPVQLKAVAAIRVESWAARTRDRRGRCIGPALTTFLRAQLDGRVSR